LGGLPLFLLVFFLRLPRRDGFHLLDCHGQSASSDNCTEHALDIRRRRRLGIVRLAHLGRRQQLFEQRSEFEFGKERAQCIHVRLSHPHGFHIQFDRNIGVDGRHALAEKDGVAIVQQRLAVGFPFDLSRMLKRLLDCAEALDDSTEPLSPMPGAPGMLSIASPRSAITSITRSGGTPRISSTFAASQIRCPSADSESVLCRSPAASCPCRWKRRTPDATPQKLAASVPITSSASKRMTSRIGIRYASSAGECKEPVAPGLRHGHTIGLIALVFDFGESLRLDIEFLDAGHRVRLLVAECRPGHIEYGPPDIPEKNRRAVCAAYSRRRKSRPSAARS